MAETIPSAAAIADLQKRLVAAWHQRAPEATSGHAFLRLLEENHLRNFTLWHHEDEARRDDLGAEHVYRAKRAIDAANQQRNDFIEKMDKALVASLGARLSPDAPASTETPGMIVDRLSILSLKEYHMAEETARPDASAEHKAKCEAKLEVIRRQIADLASGLQALLDDCAAGRRGFRVYFQFKMYNDPTLNPALYSKPKQS